MDAIIYKDTIYSGGGAMRGNYFNPIIYSTEERVVGVWINNKPLYQKTLVFENYSSSDYKDVSALNIEEVVASWGEHKQANGDYSLSFPYYENSNWYSLMTFDKTNERYYVYCSSNMANSYPYLYVTIQYTKTTDVAGSGKYNTLGVPNVHYTTDEQVIGTWVDGKPLYEIVIDFGSELSFNSGWITVTQLPHQNKYKLIFDGELISTDGLAYNVDIACNDTTYVEIYNTHTAVGRYLKFKYTKTTD